MSVHIPQPWDEILSASANHRRAFWNANLSAFSNRGDTPSGDDDRHIRFCGCACGVNNRDASDGQRFSLYRLR